jgi:hypothetical protein
LFRAGRALLQTAGVCIAALTLAFASPATAQAELNEGPKTLLTTYRATAANRAAFRDYLLTTTTPWLRAMQKRGEISGFRIYYSWYRQPAVWDAMIELQMPNFKAVERWNAVERTMPGGLDKRGLTLAEPISTASADLTWAKNPDDLRDGEVFYVIPYEYHDAAIYRAYVPGYVLPQFDGWVREGALSGYALYMNRYPVGPMWDSLFIQRYRDMNAFGRRQLVLDKVRGPLREDPTWMEWHKKKGGIRDETENSIAELIAH